MYGYFKSNIVDQFKNPMTIIIYTNVMLTRCPMCGNLFHFMDNEELAEKIKQGFDSCVYGMTRCCNRDILFQKIREQDAIHVHNGRYLENERVIETI